MKQIILKAGKDQPVRRFHPWIFSGAIAREDAGISEGEIVRVYSKTGDFLGVGHYQAGSIRVRLFTFRDEPIDKNFWLRRFQDAWAYRSQLGLTLSAETDCFRIVHAEGDGLPGLIIDIYRDTAVLQCHSIGMYRLRDTLAEALTLLGDRRIRNVYSKSRQSIPDRFRAEVEDQYLVGEGKPARVSENGHVFEVNWEKGQKTGFFLDQRENRELLARYCPEKEVLNAFSYTGGFSIYALKANARSVHSVDISEDAMEQARLNTELNFPQGHPAHFTHQADVMKFLAEDQKQYDIVVVDPPAFAKSRNKRHNAVMAYKRLNKLAIQRVSPGGILFTFSCSQVVDELLFYNTVVSAVLESGRQARVMHRMSQPADHPVSITHPEGSYLKGLAIHLS